MSEKAGPFTSRDDETDADWTEAAFPLPQNLRKPGKDEGLRLRTHFSVSERIQGRNLGIYTGVIRYNCAFYVNGVFVGKIGNPTADSYPGGLWDTLGYFFIPSNIVRFGGENELTVKILQHYSDIRFSSLSIGGINAIEQRYFTDRFKFKLLHFIAGILCMILFFPLLYFFIVHKSDAYYLLAFLSGFTYAVFCLLVSFDVPLFDFQLFYGIAIASVSLSIMFIVLTVWAFYTPGRKPYAAWLFMAITSIGAAAVYFFLGDYESRSFYHQLHYVCVYIPQFLMLFFIICYNQYRRRNGEVQIIFIGLVFLIATAIYDIVFDISQSAPIIWLSPIGVIGFSVSLYLQIANKYIEDIKLAEQDAVRLDYTNAITDEKERLDVTLNSIGDAVICTDMKGSITFFNRAASEITSCEKSAMLGKSLTEVIELETDEEEPSTIDLLALRAPGNEEEGHGAGPYVLKRCNGDKCPILITSAVIKDRMEKTIGLVWVLHDMTEHERLEKIRERNQTLESLSHLAGGIAHDFNNILAGIMLNLNLVKKIDNEKDGSLRDLITESEQSVERASHLTQQLSAFAKGGVTMIKYMDIRPLVTSSAGYTIGGSNVKVTYDFQPDLWLANVDAGQISQVIFNVVVNSLQAFDGRGEIRVTGRNLLVTEDVPFLERGPYVVIGIEDNGTGIRKEHISRIFDPYFTTKQRGAGLGLTTVYSIIKKHNGHIEVTSEENKGTTVTIYLHALGPNDEHKS